MPEYTLPPLPYPKEALEPTIGAKTMEIQHGNHHQDGQAKNVFAGSAFNGHAKHLQVRYRY